MPFLPRALEGRLREALGRRKSALVLGPRQTGKTTLLEQLKIDLLVNLLRPDVRQRYERAPHLLGAEAEALRRGAGRHLPIALAEGEAARDEDLRAYATLYLEEEVRAEALVRNLGRFSRFLQLAALEAGSISNFRGIAQELRISHTTVSGYYEILEDCLIAERIEPLSESRTRKRLTKSPRYLFFDLGVRRAAAEEGPHMPERALGPLFEQYVGLELLRATRQATADLRLRFWRDPGGPEVDWIVVAGDRWLPVEVKWSGAPGERDVRHLRTFLAEYPQAREAIVVCRTPRRFKIDANITAVPWQGIPDLVAAAAS